MAVDLKLNEYVDKETVNEIIESQKKTLKSYKRELEDLEKDRQVINHIATVRIVSNRIRELKEQLDEMNKLILKFTRLKKQLEMGKKLTLRELFYPHM